MAAPPPHPASPPPPLQADGAGNAIQGAVAGTHAAAQFSMEWMDVNPAQLSQLDVRRYTKAVQAKMPPGAWGRARRGGAGTSRVG